MIGIKMSETAHEREQREARERAAAERAAKVAEQAKIQLEKEEAEERACYQFSEEISYEELLRLLVGVGIFPTDTKLLLPVENMGTQRGLRFTGIRYYSLTDIETGAVIDRLLKDESKPVKKAVNIVEKPTLTDDELLELVKKTITEREKVVQDVRSGKVKAVEALVGSVMSKYKADAKTVKELFLKEIGNENSSN
jgi:DNA-binding transcriptional MerR regulator